MPKTSAHQVLLTGATGFVGSALAANLLAQSVSVLALSRNDTNGTRTKAAILEAAAGFGFDLSQQIDTLLQIVQVDFSDIERSVPLEALAGIEYVWHCSAEMSYSPYQLASSFHVNVGGSTRLLQWVRASCPKLRRFYYMSTAYVAGMQGGPTPERLHVAPELINAYQISKWGAEYTLHLLQTELDVPITIFRPSIVAGHSRTGWASGNGFGLYMILDALRAFAATGHGGLTFNYRPNVRPDLIPINQLVNDAVGLTLSEKTRPAFEVFHCTGGLGISNQDLMACATEITGVPVSSGLPVTPFDKRFERAVQLNMPFANVEWQFERQGIDTVLGCPTPEALSYADVAMLTQWHLKRPEQPNKARAAAPAVPIRLASGTPSAMGKDLKPAEALDSAV